MKLLPILGALLLGGCTQLEPIIPPPVMDDPECRAEAVRSPEVRAIRREINFDNQTNVRRVTTEEREAEARLYEACLRRRGLPIPGGVEPVRRLN